MLGLTIFALALAAGGASAGAAPREPTPLRGAPLQQSGLRLLVAENPPFVLDVDSGRIERLPIPAVPGVISVAGVAGTSAVVVADAGANARLYSVRGRAARITSLGVGERLAPAGDGRSVWIKRRDGTRCTLRQAALDGRTLIAARPFACATTLYPGGSLGLVVNRTRVIDPRTGRVVRRTRWGILAAAGKHLVLAGPGNRLALLDASAGTERQLRWPSILPWLDHPAADPRGRFVALSFAAPAWTGGRQVTDVWLLDVRSGTLTQLPSMPAFVALKRTSLAWTDDGRLVLLGESSGRGVVAVWRPGGEAPAVKTLRLPERSGGSDSFAPLG
ncbi:MAG: hypothetical protein H0V68_09150 [Actinobacteria bacterium]|nr:hypothetical protein [Actinomycetota bacterium]